ncbi:hypothetical protein BVRB_2g041270 [Beta vulgaris subsp. vulgaris]|nr:hypothetical protein BVRB_2g041270 [Beta vulgaris subsp. vulgaris]
MSLGEAALSAFLQVVFDKLMSPNLLYFFRLTNIHETLKKWSKTLLKIQAAISDAEQKKMNNNNNNKLVIMWLDELQDLAYDLDDILDEICTEAHLSESPIENEDNPGILRNFIPDYFNALNSTKFCFNRKIELEIENISMRLQDIVTQKDELGLLDFGVEDRNEMKGWRKSESTSLVCEPHVYGRDEEKDKVIDLLLDDEGNCSDFCVIPIVGKGGIGKTTLSQLVYNDERVKKHFDIKAWVCVSIEFDVLRITTAIMNLITGDNDCWNLLQQHAFDGVDVTTNPNIVILGKKVSEKCKGLPLAAKTLGGLLKSKAEVDEWEEILHSDIWKLQDSDVLPVLRLSYNYLPPEIDDSRYKMHDLVNDLAQWAAGDICLRLDDMEKTLVCGPDNRIRHLSFNRRKHETVTRFEDLRDITSLRTFASFSLNYCGWSFLARNIGIDLIPKFGVLRVLSLSWYYIMKLPDSIGDLKHLRYLDISGTKVKELPETIGKLCNLQTLLLAHCELLEKLPTSTRNLVNLRHLDISETTSLQEMPVGIGTLVNLKTLSRFIVGNVDGRGIGELKNLRNLRGMLFVSGLGNVVSIKDALQTRLDDKLDLSGLQVEWAGNFDLRDGEFEKNLLTLLRPPKKLKEYRLKCYGGEDFPSWLGEPSFTNMVTLTLKDCKNCRFLPSLGKLPSLKKLHIEGITRVKSVGVEFYGENCSKPFPSLKTLHFQRMEEWEEWFPPIVDESFPKLEKLLVINCPSLHKELPMHLPSLKTLEISKCLQLMVSPLSFPVLRELKIRECQAILPESAAIDISNLKTLEISQLSELICLKEELIAQFTKLDTLHIENCMELASLWCCEKTLEEGLPLLRNLVIVNCPKLLFLPCEFPREQQRQMLCHGKLESLTLQGCEKLEILPLDLVNLRALSITNCSKLNSLFKNVLQSNIKKLNIRFCNSLESATEWISSCSSLVSLSISGCPSLLSIDQIPHTLQSMEIICCEKLQMVADEGVLAHTPSSSSLIKVPSSLESLRIGGCPALTSFLGNGNLPITLKTLDVYDCQNLESLPIGEIGSTIFHLEKLKISRCEKFRIFRGGLEKLIFLTSLEISSCINLVQFGDGVLLPSGLKELNIHDCVSLEALPNQLVNLKLLQELKISSCPKVLFLPESGLPPNLTLLWLSDVNIEGPLSNWGLCRITTLKDLRVDSVGCLRSLEAFPEESMDLPASLTFLRIGELYNLKYLSVGSITNLISLTIRNCPKLILLTDTDLCHSLLQIHIYKCSCLKQQWLGDKARVWPMLSRIPCVIMDDHLYSPSKL